MEDFAMWLLYGAMGVLGLCWLTLLADIFYPDWDRDCERTLVEIEIEE
jgi:hypothetical protein